MKKKIWRLLEKYGLWQDYKKHSWIKERRDQFFLDFMNLATKTVSKNKTIKVVYEDIEKRSMVSKHKKNVGRKVL